ncbi:hypothetical protein [Sphingobacterium mizutaii]|nr:hypothetical protein [Sphingobacterium mizutaii]
MAFFEPGFKGFEDGPRSGYEPGFKGFEDGPRTGYEPGFKRFEDRPRLWRTFPLEIFIFSVVLRNETSRNNPNFQK